MPLTVSLQFPTGRYAAASWSDKDTVEWPPHPVRLCLGLLDALHNAGNPPDERKALGWLCEQKAPEIVIPADRWTDERVIDGVYVPQNPIYSGMKKLKGVNPPLKPRSFPVVFLDADRPTVFFRWADANVPEEIDGAFKRLVVRLPRLGHSSSLVFASLSASPDIDSDWRIFSEADPSEASDHFRVPWSGLVKSAEDAYAAGDRENEMKKLMEKAASEARKDKLLKPSMSSRGRHDPRHRWVRYMEMNPGSRVCETPWDRNVILLEQTRGSRLGLQSTWQVTEVLHKTLIDRWSRSPSRESMPPWISGHASTGPVRHCHLALFPLPFVGYKHADGHLLGLGLALPKFAKIGLTREQWRSDWQKARDALLGEEGSLKLVADNQSWTMSLKPVSSPTRQQALKPQRWTEPACVWRSITPVILHRHPKPHFKKDPAAWKESCRAILREACEQLSLPAPLEIEPQFASSVAGAPSSAAFAPPPPRVERPPRFHIHASLKFADPVAGPMLLGAGRYRGYGLFVPC
ncbi:MAG: hypothetical protein M2R45_00442 [Verrucomicrobia subdivision 3 bacterium]|nr:hypothetical protein [Limisphaerales bacterium]MCS1413678.1 hypothetical protein [Limisphaerales bacterium]